MSKIMGGGGDNGAAAAEAAAAERRRQEELARQAEITRGMESVNQAFAGFDEPFFEARRSAVMDFYEPQLQEQFTNQRRGLMNNLANAGLLRSTTANEAFADLNRQLAMRRAEIANRAQGQVGQLRNQITQQRNDLLSRVNANANADLANAQALAASRALRETTPEFSPLGTVFTPLAVGAGNFINARREGQLLREADALTAADPRAEGSTIKVG